MDEPITYSLKKQIVEEIRLKPNHHHRIYLLMKTCDVPMTSNSNGIFFDMNYVPDDVFVMIKNLLRS